MQDLSKIALEYNYKYIYTRYYFNRVGSRLDRLDKNKNLLIQEYEKNV